MRLLRISLQGFFQKSPTAFEIWLGIQASTDFGNVRRFLLALEILNLKLQRLQPEIAGVLLALLLRQFSRMRKIACCNHSLNLSDCMLDRLPLSPDSVVRLAVHFIASGHDETLSMAVEFDNFHQLAERCADLATAIGAHCGLVLLLLFLAGSAELILTAVGVSYQFRHIDIVAPDLSDLFNSLPRLSKRVIMEMLMNQAVPLLALLVAATGFDFCLKGLRFRVPRVPL